jgi:hypothetical protein
VTPNEELNLTGGLRQQLARRVRELQSWGRREFHIVLPSGVCLQFFDETDEPRPPIP